VPFLSEQKNVLFRKAEHSVTKAEGCKKRLVALKELSERSSELLSFHHLDIRNIMPTFAVE